MDASAYLTDAGQVTQFFTALVGVAFTATVMGRTLDCGYQGAVHDQRRVLCEPLARLDTSFGPRWPMRRLTADFDTPNGSASCR
ncbi:hypothetical protein BCF44_10661 [Kutzneria buriramensis]|uniref:Uncharacterized protein n=1 Tax=Kutzneria buriramensis TaxID=1045776 RepID=A0A3E0HKF7_9PSEU|nr:hypothetical protein BCF44_10661 [Kutzneria buriramensis]